MPVQTSQDKKKVIYSDFFTNFDIHPERGDLSLSTNEEAVKQSLRNILMTDNYERVRDPGFSGGIKGLLFELADTVTETVARDRVASVIKQREPRAKLLGVSVKSNPDKHHIEVAVRFYIINILEPVTLNLILERVG